MDRKWDPKVESDLLEDLAEATKGYCGSDLKALCTEAALRALERRYPQIYHSEDKLKIDVSAVRKTHFTISLIIRVTDEWLPFP